VEETAAETATMPGKSLDFPSERDEHLRTPGHHPDQPPQKLDRRRAGGPRESGESAKTGTGEHTRRHTEEAEHPLRT
jgi:hypothetical protein